MSTVEKRLSVMVRWEGARFATSLSTMLPAIIGNAEITGPAGDLIGYLPDPERDVVRPLTAPGYSRTIIASLGDVYPT